LGRLQVLLIHHQFMFRVQVAAAVHLKIQLQPTQQQVELAEQDFMVLAVMVELQVTHWEQQHQLELLALLEVVMAQAAAVAEMQQQLARQLAHQEQVALALVV
jgi:hypothetical protein